MVAVPLMYNSNFARLNLMVAVPLMYKCTIKSDVQLQVSLVGADTIGGTMVSSRIEIFCRGGGRNVHGQKLLLISKTPAASA